MRPSEDRDGRSERARVYFERLYRIPGHGSSSRIFYISPPDPIFAMVEGTSPSSAGLDASPNPLVPTQAAGAAGPPPGRPPSKRALLITAAIVIVALVILAALLTGVLPGLRSSSGGNPGEALAYSAALPLANTAAANAPGGPWTLVIGTGYDVSAAFPFGGAIFLISHSMDLHYLTTARPDIPRFGGSLSSGLSPWWLFWYDNGTTGGIFGDANLLFVAVVDGTGIALATGTTTYQSAVPPQSPGAPTLDSPAAMAVAVTSNASYIDAHPGLNASFTPSYYNFPGLRGWFWNAYFSTCAPFAQVYQQGATQYNGTFYGAAVNATSGALLGSGGSPQKLACSSLG